MGDTLLKTEILDQLFIFYRLQQYEYHFTMNTNLYSFVFYNLETYFQH